MASKRKLGLIVNPIAGIGGRVGLKGSDGEEVIKKAVELGAVITAPSRAIESLKRIIPIKEKVEIITYPYEMGENEAKDCSFDPIIIGSITKGQTTAEDTIKAAIDMLKIKVDLILFAGGDGTARDIHRAVGDKVPVLGIPAGVKIHSGVYAVTPRSAGDLAVLYLRGESVGIREAEVMDIDEKAFREDRVSARLYGYLMVPYEKTLVQSPKAGSVAGEEQSLEDIANEVLENMSDDYIYVIGPGTTTRPIIEKLGLKKTLLGVDVIQRGKLLASDVNEEQLLKIIAGRKTKIVVTVIGGQGFLFGRGNQQISPDILREVGRENIIIVTTMTKLASLRGAPLLVDTGEEEVDNMLDGYFKITTGYGRKVVYKVKSYN